MPVMVRAWLERVVHVTYGALWTALLPPLAAYLALNPRHRALLGRVRRPSPALPRAAIWVHACSVGEVNAARPLLAAIVARLPQTPVLLSVSTRTGDAQAAASLPDVPRAWFPLDHPWLAARWFDALEPRALVLIETELWPAVLHEARRRAVPVILVNGRLSDRHFMRYRRAPLLIAPMMRAITVAVMQSERYAERIARLGVDGARIQVGGSVKFDGAILEAPVDARARLAQTLRPDPARPVIVFGSTRPGDEARALEARQALLAAHVHAQWILALRHPERIEAAERACDGVPVRRRGACTTAEPWQGGEVLLVDTLGELIALYALADVAVIGGSFDAAVQGHNPIEPAALGKPVVFGPCMDNFAEAAELLVEAGGAQRIASADALGAVLLALVQDPERRQCMGACGRAAVLAHQGAASRHAKVIARLLENG